MHRTRRELVAGAVPLAGLALVPNAWAARLLDKTPRIGPGTFKDSVASGDPTPEAVSFWSRLTTDRPRSGARLIVAEDEGLSRVVAQTVVPTGRAMDHCLKARVGGLRPATTYYYAWQSGEEASPIGRTRTAPGAGSRAPVRIAVSSCQRFVDGFSGGVPPTAFGLPLRYVARGGPARPRPRDLPRRLHLREQCHEHGARAGQPDGLGRSGVLPRDAAPQPDRRRTA